MRFKNVNKASIAISGIFIAFCFSIFMFGAVNQAGASKSALVSVGGARASSDVTIIRGMADVIKLTSNVSDVMVANPSIVDVTVIQSDKLYIVGMTAGRTNIITLDAEGNVIQSIPVSVIIDIASIQEVVNDIFPGQDVTLRAVGDQVVLTGTVSDPSQSQLIATTVAGIVGDMLGEDASVDDLISNLLNVKGKAQVTLRVKIMEVTRTMLREMGTDTDITDIGGLLGDEVGNSPDLAGLFGGVVSTGVTETPYATFGLLESIGAFGPIESVITLLEEEGLARILAEPNLTAISGQQAGFLAGGEFPVPSGRDSEGNIEITFRQFGVALTFAPIVLSDDRISLQLETEVSSLARQNQVQLIGVEVPGLDIRRATTTVEMGSGGTLMIAGLLQSEAVNNLAGLPGLTDTPILGDLFSSDSFRRDETELVILVTPYLVEPFADKEQANHKKLPDPDPNQLTQAFTGNIQRMYGTSDARWFEKIGKILDEEGSYGYILHE